MIDGTGFGWIKVGNEEFRTDVVVWWDGEIEEREKSHTFSRKELLDLLARDPEAVVVGTGQSGMCSVERDAENEARLHGVELVAARTPEAAEVFNRLVRRKRVVGVFHVTC